MVSCGADGRATESLPSTIARAALELRWRRRALNTNEQQAGKRRLARQLEEIEREIRIERQRQERLDQQHDAIRRDVEELDTTRVAGRLAPFPAG